MHRDAPHRVSRAYVGCCRSRRPPRLVRKRDSASRRVIVYPERARQSADLVNSFGQGLGGPGKERVDER